MDEHRVKQRLRLVDLDEAHVWLQQEQPTLVIAGAGLSMGPPTFAPGVADFLSRTLHHLVDAVDHASHLAKEGHLAGRESVADIDIDDLCRRLLPESCYGVIGQVYDTSRHLEMWAALGPAAAARVGSRPSPAHHLLARLSAERGWPIVTTNFDCFIELAAEEAGYGCEVTVPRVSDRILLRPESARATLLKLHGSANRDANQVGGSGVERIRATAADLSRCAQIMERLRFSPDPTRLLVIGYSGRDLDLFPWLCSRFADSTTASDNVLWVDPAFAHHKQETVASHRAMILVPHVVGLAASANDLAMVDAPEVAASELDRQDHGLRSRYRERAEKHVDDALASVLRMGSPENAAVLAGVLSAVGQHDAVVALEKQLYGQGADTYGTISGLLWLAGAYGGLDRYDEAVRVTREVRRRALRARSVSTYLRGWIASAYMGTAGASLMVLPSPGARRFRKLLGPYSAVFAITAAAAPFTVAAYLTTRNREDPPAGRSALVADYIEHWIRLGALLEKVRGRIPLSGVALDALWKLIERFCRAAGYTTGVLTAGRYRARVAGSLQWFDSAVTRAELVNHPIGLAIAHRDAALALRARGGDDAEVREHLAVALAEAIRARSPSLILKVRHTQTVLGLGQPMQRVEVDDLIQQMTGCDAVRRQASEIVAVLSS